MKIVTNLSQSKSFAQTNQLKDEKFQNDANEITDCGGYLLEGVELSSLHHALFLGQWRRG